MIHYEQGGETEKTKVEVKRMRKKKRLNRRELLIIAEGFRIGPNVCWNNESKVEN